MKPYVFGIDVGGTTIKAGFFTTEGELLDKWEIPTRTQMNGKYILDDVADAIVMKMSERGISKNSVEGIGIGVPGPVDNQGIVKGCVNLGWGEVNVTSSLETKLGLKVRVGNDANVAALGEAWKGAAEGTKNCLMVTLGTGVGGGIIIDGKIIAGVHGAGGEIGHICVNDDEIASCNCGKQGCLEQYASATGIVRLAKMQMKSFCGESVLMSNDAKKQSITAKDVFDAAKDGDKLALNIVNEVSEILGKTLANIACVCDPEAIVIGGGVSKAGEILRNGVESSFINHAFHACKTTKIVLASLGNDAGMYGSAGLLLQ